MSHKVKNILKLALGLGLLAVAGAVFVKGESWFSHDQPPDTADSSVPWYCYHCQKGFDLTARAYADAVRFGPHPGVKSLEGGDAPPAVAMVPCPVCKQGAIQAKKCPADGTIFDGSRWNPDKPVCPKCGWNPNEATGD